MTNDDFQTHVVDALARLDVKMTDLVGNGKPGRVAILEKTVSQLNKFKWMIMGGAMFAGAAIHFIFKY
jgi:hypothetical protein